MPTPTARFAFSKPATADNFLTSDFDTLYDSLDAAIAKGFLGGAWPATSGNITSSTTAGTFTNLVAVTVTIPAGGRTIGVHARMPSVAATSGGVVAQILRGATVLQTYALNGQTNIGTTAYPSTNFDVFFYDNPTAGPQTYTLQFRYAQLRGFAFTANSGSDFAVANQNGTTQRVRLEVFET